MSNAPPISPYGSDLACVFTSTGVGDMTAGASEVSGVMVVVQRILRRITTRKGTVIGCPNDCLDIRDFLRAGNTPQALAGLQGQLQAEIAKDEAVTSVSANVVYSTQTGTMSITLSIVTGLGPFTLVLNISSLTLAILLNGAPLAGVV